MGIISILKSDFNSLISSYDLFSSLTSIKNYEIMANIENHKFIRCQLQIIEICCNL